MIEFKNIKISKNVKEDGSGYSYIYFEDEHHRDWYETRDKEWKGVNKFIATDESEFVVTFSDNPNFLTLAEGMNVYEVVDYPDDISTAVYKYQGGKFLSQEPSTWEIAEQEKNRLISEATTMISVLQDAVDLGMATEDDESSLIAWKTYRVMLSRVDTHNPEWPDKPAS
ncbi:phage tail protein [Kosakonia radicincitans]|uniref:tail fiber assembly protein n=1 Tax=Kosakonia radicincitans TaxID=283686 RepID=UPI000903D1AB|nr:tail fiber assembly protein [Kosakonia radicincitans]APG20003.1 phage tail protein [Kosakonia radicincitans]